MQKQIIFLIAVLAVGVWLRFSLVSKPGYAYDIQSFVSWGRQVEQTGIRNFYKGDEAYNGYKYPPVVPMMTSILLKITPKIAPETAFKYLPILFDIILSVLTIIFVYKSSLERKYLLTAIVAIQPAFALVSGAWGQVDSILATFLILAAILAIKYEYLATIVFIFSILVKPQAILAVGIYYVFLLFSKSLKQFARQVIFGVVLFIIAEIILEKICGVGIWYFIKNSVGAYKNLSLNAFNLWWAIYGHNSWNIQDDVGKMISYKSVGMTLFVLFLFPALLYLKTVKKVAQLMLVLGYAYLLFFIFPSQIHERYLFTSVAFLAFAPLVDKKFFWPYCGLVLSFMLNIFAVLQSVYPQFNFLRINLLLGDWTRIVALFNIVVCMYFFWWFSRETIIKN